MAYATIGDVRRLMAQFNLGPTTKPTETETESIISDIEQEVNVALAAKGIVVPVASPSEFMGWLKMLVSYGATAAALKSMFPSATGPGETPAYAFWESRYKAGLAGIANGSLLPPGLNTKLGIKPRTYFVRNPNEEETLGDIAEPFFKRGKNY